MWFTGLSRISMKHYFSKKLIEMNSKCIKFFFLLKFSWQQLTKLTVEELITVRRS